MALGHKTGGRKAGTPNRKTQEIGELLESLGHNPIEAMVQIATEPKASLELRGRMNAEPAQYVYPKRKAAEVASDQGAPIVPSRVVVEIVPTPSLPIVELIPTPPASVIDSEPMNLDDTPKQSAPIHAPTTETDKFMKVMARAMEKMYGARAIQEMTVDAAA